MNVSDFEIPSREEADKILEEASKLNPGPWVEHSKKVGEAAELIASRIEGLDSDCAYVMGILHDIGRRAGVYKMRHGLDGYRYLVKLGYSSVARVCLTHTSFTHKNKPVIVGSWDGSEEEYVVAITTLSAFKENDYDKLIKLCDYMSLPSGFCLLEKRLVDISRRGGVNDLTLPRWESTFKIKDHFEEQLGCSVYELLPNVIDCTFEISE